LSKILLLAESDHPFLWKKRNLALSVEFCKKGNLGQLMLPTILILLGLLFILLSVLIFTTQRYSWARHENSFSSYWSQFAAAISAILFIATIAVGIWQPRYVTIPAILLVISIVAPVLVNLYTALKKRKD